MVLLRFSLRLLIILTFVAGSGCNVISSLRPFTWSLTVGFVDPAMAREEIVAQAVRVLEARLQAIGVSRFEVKPLGPAAEGRILVKLPSVPDRQRLKQLIVATAHLEIVHVISAPNPAPTQTYMTRDEALANLGGADTAKCRVLPYSEREELRQSGAPVQPARRWLCVEVPSIIDGRDLRTATAIRSRGDANSYNIAFSLKPEGANKFAAWTGANINEYLGVVLNDEVKSVAFIKSQLSDSGEIAGRFTKQAAEDLALTLRSGPMPAALRVISEQEIK
jgi:protein-export membrane protein SecD